MKTLFKILLVLVILFVVFPFAAYKYFFSSGPRDLGVTFTESDRAAAYAANGVESIAITSSPDNPRGIKYEGQKDIQVSFTSEQITALNNSVKWVNYPVSHVQIKINPDGTGEASGILDIRKILSWVSFTHPVKEIEAKVDEYHIGLNPAFYLKGRVTVTDNRVSLTPQTIEVGRITIPQNIVAENISPVEKFVDARLSAVPNLKIRSLNLDGGKVNLDATVPEKEYTVQP
ncbi:MAG: hypothetical protein WAV41_00115 [Microgenomates group bacterium]